MHPCGLQMRRCGSDCNVLLTSIRVLLDQVHDCSIVNITMPPVLRCPLPCAPVATSSAASLQIADQVKRSASPPVCVLQLAHNPHGPCDGSPARRDTAIYRILGELWSYTGRHLPCSGNWV